MIYKIIAKFVVVITKAALKSEAVKVEYGKNKKTFKKLKIYGCETLTFSAYIVRASFLTLIAL